MTDDKLGVISPGLPFAHASANLSLVICRLSFTAALFYCGSLHGVCIPSSTPAPAAVAAARSEINAFEPFLREPLCEQIAVKYQLAADYASIAEADKTIELAQEVAQADQGFDFPLDGAFKRLAYCPDFVQIADKVNKLYPAVHQSVSAFTVDDQLLIPEGLAYDERTHSFLMGSLNEKKIVRYDENGRLTDFVPPKKYGLTQVLGIRMDPNNGSVWVASGEDALHAALFHFSPTGQLIRKYPPPAGKSDHLFNDVVVCRDGDVYLTDSTAHQVYKLPRGQTKLVPVPTSRHLFYPNGIALSDDDRSVFIADAFGLLVLDRNDSSVRPVRPGQNMTLSGFDGLYTWENQLVGVQNSMGSPRLVMVQLDNTRTEATALKVLERKTQCTQLPTTGAIVGDTFYYITNSQIDHYQGGKVSYPETLAPIVVAKVELK
jgi:DNA-binding beta-propeller fold protein YncE